MRGRTMVVAVLAASGLVACSSSTAGTGGGSAPPPSTPAAVSSPSASTVPASSAAPASTAPVSSAPVSAPLSSAPVPSASLAPASSPPPTAVAAPRACAAGHCTKIRTADLDDGYTATVYSGPSPSGQVAADFLELRYRGVPVFWRTTDGYSPGELVCSPTPAPNCAVEDAFGAHASSARGFARIGNTLIQFDEATSDTPVTDVQDLNGDGWIDVVAAQNTYEPSYATGKVFWSTSLSNGKKFIVSGCTAPKTRLAPKPTAPVTGTCVS